MSETPVLKKMLMVEQQSRPDPSKDRGKEPSTLTSDSRGRLRAHIQESVATKFRVLESCEEEILIAASRITQALRQGKKLLLCGNGGSAADCQHIAAEFVSVLRQDFLRPGLAAIAMTTDTSVLTASANDFGFAGIFERQVQALGEAGDVLLGISTSGNSENVVRAMSFANERKLHTVALVGQSGGLLAKIAHTSICVPSATVMHIQESHIMIGHIICELVERSLYPDGQAYPVLESLGEPPQSMIG